MLIYGLILCFIGAVVMRAAISFFRMVFGVLFAMLLIGLTVFFAGLIMCGFDPFRLLLH